MKTYYPTLSIAGSDSSGGAGIQADIKTMSEIGTYAMTAITAITAQNTTGVKDILGIAPEIVKAQIDTVFDDIRPLATKTGMLYSKEIVACVAEALIANRVTNLVVDPVMVSTSGHQLITDDAIDAVVKHLFPISTLITPNRDEAIRLSGTTDVSKQAAILHSKGAKNILLKGGDKNDTYDIIDYLSLDNGRIFTQLKSDRINTPNTHGTGCTLSSAIASYLALGYSLESSVKAAKDYISAALINGADIKIGNGHGPVNHFFSPDKLNTLQS